ncbi:MAG: acetyl-CoA carboxylase biotin carboxyl carrier protein subunit [Haliea sp.]|nr:acetyl-CoA carboxylase biotin carboxyl carrier protein subunit [Haliea sp.]
MQALVIDVAVAAGDRVERGAPLVTLEAMKMQHVITATAAGTVASVAAMVGKQVNAGEMLLEIHTLQN